MLTEIIGPCGSTCPLKMFDIQIILNFMDPFGPPYLLKKCHRNTSRNSRPLQAPMPSATIATFETPPGDCQIWTRGNPGKPGEIHGNPGKSREIWGNPEKSGKIRGNPWKSFRNQQKSSGNPLKSSEILIAISIGFRNSQSKSQSKTTQRARVRATQH